MTAGPTHEDLQHRVEALEKRILDVEKLERLYQAAQAEARQHRREVEALMGGCQAVLKYQGFEDAARAIFIYCKDIIGATAGYVALCDENNQENRVVFLEPGALQCDVDTTLPMPIRGLRKEVYDSGQAHFHNDFARSPWVQFLPPRHVRLENVLFAPLMVDERVIGLLGLANKPGGFTENDARLATGFGELAAVALVNSQALDERRQSEATLKESEARFRQISSSAQDAIIMIESDGKITFWNEAAERIFGYAPEEMIGRSLHATLVPQRHLAAYQKGFEMFKNTGQGAAVGKVIELWGLKKDGSEIPVELSLSSVKLDDQWGAVGILRDISERKWAEQELQRARNDLEIRVAERTAELLAANEQLMREIEERTVAEEALRTSKERFDLAVRGSRDGLWDWDITANKMYFSPRLMELLGYPEGERLERFDDWAARIHPDDYQRVMTVLQGHLSGKKPFDVEYLYRSYTEAL